MLTVIEPADQWSQKYGIKVTEEVCLKCKERIKLDIPIAIKGYRGFKMREHGCPDEYIQYILTPCSVEESRKLRQAVH